MAYDAHFRVWRGDSDGGDLEDFTVEVNEGEVVLDVIHRLQATQTPDLAVRWNCKAGKCGSCSAEINGRPRLMCMTRMSTLVAEETVTVTPMRAFPVVRDLVTDVSFNYEKARAVPAFVPPSDLQLGEFRMQQVDVERSQEFRKCIECFLCQNTCHVIRDHEENKPVFSGPRLFIRLAELDMHPLDTLDRKRQAQEQHGLGYCNITKCCTEVCPEGIHITDNGIIPMKERVVDKKYDPVVFLGKKILRRGGASTSATDVATTESAARQRVSVNPTDKVAWGTLAQSLRVQGRFDEAVEAASRRIELVRGRGESRRAATSELAWDLMCAAEAGQLRWSDVGESAARMLAEAQRLIGTGTTLSNHHALLARLEGRLVAATEHALETLSWPRSSADQSDAWLTLASVRSEEGDETGGAEALGLARSLSPINPRLRAPLLT